MRLSILILICLLSPAVPATGSEEKLQSPAVPATGTEEKSLFPDTPTGRALTAFFRAVEKGDDETLRTFIEKHLDSEFRRQAALEEHLDQLRQIHEALGEVEVTELDKIDHYAVELVVLGVKTGKMFNVRMRLSPDPPHRISGLGAFPAEDEPPQAELSAEYAGYRDPNEVVDGELGRKLDDFVTGYMDKGFSGVVLAVYDGRKVLHKGYGLADRERGIPNTTETVFDVASYAKSFTMAAILKLEEAGKLATEDKITKFFEDVPGDKREITIHHLLKMRSGLHEYHDESGDFEEMDRGEAVRRIMNQDLRFKPGEDRGYSNSGYTLLAVIIEKISGQAYKEYLSEHLFGPAGLKHTGFYGDPRWKEDRVAHGYNDRKFGEENSPLHWPEITWACIGNGCLCSTPADLGRWLDALHSCKVLSRETVDKLYSEYLVPVETDWGGPALAMVDANDFGFTGASFQFPESNSYLLVTSNAGRMMAPRVAKPLARLMMGSEP